MFHNKKSFSPAFDLAQEQKINYGDDIAHVIRQVKQKVYVFTSVCNVCCLHVYKCISVRNVCCAHVHMCISVCNVLCTCVQVYKCM